MSSKSGGATEQSEEVRSVSLEEFVIYDAGERMGPPDSPVLRVRNAGPHMVTVAIERYDEDNKTATFTRMAEVIVDLEPLWNGLAAMRTSEGLKPRV